MINTGKAGGKLLSLLLVLTLLMSLVPVGAWARSGQGEGERANPLAENGSTVTVNLRVEGINENIFEGEVTVGPGEEAPTALDALEQGLGGEGIPYDIQQTEWGPYINAIQGEAAGTFGGWDGWIYLVNGVIPEVGAAAYAPEEGDQLIFYYGMYPPDTLIPRVEIDPEDPEVGQDLRVTVSSSYVPWGSDDPVEVKITGAAVIFSGEEFLTGEGGTVVIPGSKIPGVGVYELQVRKDQEDSYPAIVRTGIITVESFKPEPPGVEETLAGVVRYYRENKRELTSWWDLVALWGAGVDLQDGTWTLPAWGAADLAIGSPAVTYAGYILGMLARGDNPARGGEAWENRDLVQELQGIQQGDGSFGGTVNNTIWAIVALEASGGQYDREKALDYLLGQQKADGGFALGGEAGDPDMTGMALSALSNFKGQGRVDGAIQEAVDFLQEKQLDTAGFASWGSDNSNSLAVALSGLVAAGEDLLEDPAWKKNGVTVLESLQRFQLEDGSFSFLLDPLNSNPMATNQSLIALGDLKEGETVWGRLAVPPAGFPAVEVNLRVEGINENIFEGEVTVGPGEETPTALDALEQGLGGEGIPYDIQQTEWGPYINAIQGEAAGTFGGWDGWIYLVNGVIPEVGAAAYALEEGDQLIFYYGMYPPDTLIPLVEMDSENPEVGQDLRVTVTSSYLPWGSDDPVEVKITGAAVIFNGEEFLTGEGGTVVIPGSRIPGVGVYELQVRKDQEDSYPAIVRTGIIKVGVLDDDLIARQIEEVLNRHLGEYLQIKARNPLIYGIIQPGKESTSLQKAFSISASIRIILDIEKLYKFETIFINDKSYSRAEIMEGNAYDIAAEIKDELVILVDDKNIDSYDEITLQDLKDKPIRVFFAGFEFTFKITDDYVDDCFIATAAYGSRLSPAVILLRQFRDEVLLRSRGGKELISLYYRNSPPVAGYIASSRILVSLVRLMLLPAVTLAYLALHQELLLALLVLALLAGTITRRRLIVSRD